MYKQLMKIAPKFAMSHNGSQYIPENVLCRSFTKRINITVCINLNWRTCFPKKNPIPNVLSLSIPKDSAPLSHHRTCHLWHTAVSRREVGPGTNVPAATPLSLLARYPVNSSAPSRGFRLAPLSTPRSRLRTVGISPRTSAPTIRYLPAVVLHIWDSALSRLLTDFHRSAHIASVVQKCSFGGSRRSGK